MFNNGLKIEKLGKLLGYEWDPEGYFKSNNDYWGELTSLRRKNEHLQKKLFALEHFLGIHVEENPVTVEYKKNKKGQKYYDGALPCNVATGR